ncbi:MAG: hypothetical protein FWF84_06805, partial [Kiritimatiellaeota bacterium]|nr:hypothetical protein [Kiritimatiellota bacterium]
MWLELTTDMILSRLTAPEKAALETAAKDFAQDDPIADVAAQVAAEWRGAIARLVAVDRRPLFVPSELLIHVL